MSQNSYTRNDLAVDFSSKQGCSVESARTQIEYMLDSVTQALVMGKKVEFRGFGVLETRRRKEKTGRNPRNPSATYTIPAKTVVKFRTGKELDAAINQEEAAPAA